MIADKITKISTMSAYELGKNSKNKIPKIPIVKLRPRILFFEYIKQKIKRIIDRKINEEMSSNTLELLGL